LISKKYLVNNIVDSESNEIRNAFEGIGGGYIACELAHFFGSLGTTINIIQKGNFLIPNEDIEISQKFTEIFTKKYNVYLYNAESISKKTIKDGINSNKTFHLVAKTPAGKSIELRSDQLLLDVGRVPNSDTLGLEASGVKTNKKSFIITYGYLETNVKGIFALGDAIGHYLFNIMQTMRHSMLIIISCIPMTRLLSAMPQCRMQFLALLKSPA
jgi:pyruvate/2-oxoglutarate dehydrogenase complex dihydrolipoamide dehydrogenase (E3) component